MHALQTHKFKTSWCDQTKCREDEASQLQSRVFGEEEEFENCINDSSFRLNGGSVRGGKPLQHSQHLHSQQNVTLTNNK